MAVATATAAGRVITARLRGPALVGQQLHLSITQSLLAWVVVVDISNTVIITHTRTDRPIRKLTDVLQTRSVSSHALTQCTDTVRAVFNILKYNIES